MGSTVLVTGGAGYVGSHIVVALARAGYAPIVVDNFANSSETVLPRLRSLTGAELPEPDGPMTAVSSPSAKARRSRLSTMTTTSAAASRWRRR